MWHNLKIYLIPLPLFFVIDYIWLGKIMVGFYKQELGPLARRVGEDLSPHLGAALIVYLLIPLGIVLFALPHVSQTNMPGSALFWGGLYVALADGKISAEEQSRLGELAPARVDLDAALRAGPAAAELSLERFREARRMRRQKLHTGELHRMAMGLIAMARRDGTVSQARLLRLRKLGDELAPRRVASRRSTGRRWPPRTASTSSSTPATGTSTCNVDGTGVVVNLTNSPT